MSFDLFVQSCIILKRMTDVFKKYDEDRDGYITLSFEEFLTGESAQHSLELKKPNNTRNTAAEVKKTPVEEMTKC